jgi:hypothetical protein
MKRRKRRDGAHEARPGDLPLFAYGDRKPTFDAEEGRRRRDEGMADVSEPNEEWQEAVLAFIAALPLGWTGPAERLRGLWFEIGGDPPTHVNCWGAAIRVAACAGLISHVGRFVHAESVAAHARKVELIERVPPAPSSPEGGPP